MADENDDATDDQAQGGDDNANDDAGPKPAAGLMADADDDADAIKGDTDSDKTIDFVDGDKTEALKVPVKFLGADGEINHGAVLKSALDAGKTVRQLQNDLAEAKKAGPDTSEAPDTPEGYLTDDLIKDGVFQKPEGVGKLSDIPADDPALVGFTEIAKDAGLTPKQFEMILSRTMLMADGIADEPFDAAAELEKFGANGKAVAGTNKAWAGNLLEAGEISQAEHTHLLNMGQTAVGLSVVNKLRMMGGGVNIPMGAGGVDGELPSKAEWYATKPDPRTDPDLYAKWQKQGEQLFGTEPAGSSEAGHGMAASRGGSMQAQRKPGDNTRTRGTR